MEPNVTRIPLEEAEQSLPGGSSTKTILSFLSEDGKTVTLDQISRVQAVYREGFNDALSAVQSIGIVELANCIRGGGTEGQKGDSLHLDLQKLGWVKPAPKKA